MKKNLRIGNAGIGRIPRIVATLHKGREANMLDEPLLRETADIIELRADRLYGGRTDKLERIIARIKKNGFPVILTAREGDGYRFSRGERTGLYLELIPLADAVDIELSPSSAAIESKTKECGKTLIISFHDFEKTPAPRRLERIAGRAAAKGADIVKIAAMPITPRDAASFMCSCMDVSRRHPAVFISMGETGEFTRIFAPFFGSCLTYGCISAPAAPGQIKVNELHEKLKRHYPDLHGR